MYWVDLYYNKLERVQTIEQRRVYLATDDSNLLPEAKEKYVSAVFMPYKPNCIIPLYDYGVGQHSQKEEYEKGPRAKKQLVHGNVML